MVKLVILYFFLLNNFLSFSQRNIDGLMLAEKNFAAYSVVNGTKEAFLKFADRTGIVFDSGKPVNAIEIWAKREKGPGKLNWWPEYAEIAASGNFGYTAGPWSFAIDDTIRGRGYFATVWHINKTGEWRFLIDLGVGDINCDFAGPITHTLQDDSQDKGTEASLRQAEESFIIDYPKNGKLSYKAFLSDYSRLYRNRRCVADHPEQRYWAFDSLPPKIQYMINGSGIAQSGDLGYTFGTTVINGKTENYLRIWRREKTGWKIALEVLRY